MSVFPPPSSTYPSLPLPQLRSRQTKHLRRVRKILIVTAALFVSAFILTVLVFYGFIAWTLGRPNHDALQSNPMLAVGLPYEDVSFMSTTKKSTLEGWYIPSIDASAKTVIFSHSYAGNREEPWMPIYKLASALHNKHFNVLMFDYGYVNKAHQHPFTGGVIESRELLGAVNYVKQRGAAQVIVWGFSMGAGTALQAGLLTKDISAMILDSTFIATPETMFHNIKQQINLPEAATKAMLNWLFPYINGIGFNQIPYQKVLSAVYKFPILFIHGKEDERSPYQIIERVAHNQTVNAQSSIWLKPKARHELVYDTDPKGYYQKTMAFMDLVSPAI